MNKDLTVGKPERVLWMFCLPLLGSVIFQQLYNIADSLIAGKFAGEDALAAVGNSYEVTLIYLAFAFGCNVGCSVIVSQFFGAKKYKDMKTAIYTTFIFSFILCVALMVIGFVGGDALLHLIHTQDNIYADSKLYLQIYTGGLLFLFFYNIATGIFSALGDSKTPFIFLAISSVSNVLVDIYFVKVCGYGVAGVAWATFICQGLSCIFSLIVVFRRISKIEVSEDEGKPRLFSKEIFVSIIKIAIPSTLQQSFVSIGNIVIQGIINSFGSSVTAGYAAAIKLNNMIISGYGAVGTGMSNFTAQNLGAGKTERIPKGLKAGIKIVFCVTVPVTILYFFAGGFFVNLFMDKDVNLALKVGVKFLRIVAPFYLIVATKITCDGVLRGVGAMRQFMIATFADLILRVSLAFLFSWQWGSVGIWLSWPVGWITGSALSVFFYRGLKKGFVKEAS